MNEPRDSYMEYHRVSDTGYLTLQHTGTIYPGLQGSVYRDAGTSRYYPVFTLVPCMILANGTASLSLVTLLTVQLSPREYITLEGRV